LLADEVLAAEQLSSAIVRGLEAGLDAATSM
jgi:hypothetical protein